MSKPQRQDSLPTSVSVRSPEGRTGERAAVESHPPNPAAQASTSGASSNPFASLAPAPGVPRDANAETKLFEVPRELIEMARSRARDPGPYSSPRYPASHPAPSEALTPIAPRPTIELRAALHDYTAPVSNAHMRAPVARGAFDQHDSELVVLLERRSNPCLVTPPMATKPVARSGRWSRLWLVWAGAILAYCAYILFAS
jgi:hypothetical protein